MRPWLLMLALIPACRCATLPDAEWACHSDVDCSPPRPACVDGHCRAAGSSLDAGSMGGRAAAGGLSVGPSSAASTDGRFRAQGALELPVAADSAASDGGRFQASGGFIQ